MGKGPRDLEGKKRFCQEKVPQAAFQNQPGANSQTTKGHSCPGNGPTSAFSVTDFTSPSESKRNGASTPFQNEHRLTF